MDKKTLLFTVGEDIIARNILAKELLVELTKSEVFIVFLVQKGKTEMLQRIVGENYKIVEYKRGKVGRQELILNSLARSGIKNDTNLWSKMRSYERGDSTLIATLSKRFITFIFGRSSLYKKIIRHSLLTVSPDSECKSIFDTYKPDIVFASSLSNYDFDVPIAREAKRRNIKLVGMVRSWDNLTSHGLLRVVPDVFLFQNVFLKEMAEKHQDILMKDIKSEIVGLPHYDDLADITKVILPREAFLAHFGLKENEKYILYGAMGKFLFIHEDELLPIFEDVLSKKEINVSKIVYRAHPKFKLVNLENSFPHVEIDTSGEYVADSGRKEIDNNAYLLNSIYHSELVISGASTMVIDSIIMDKPVVCVAFDGMSDGKVRYYESVRRFYDLYTHFEDLMEQHGCKIAYNKEQMIKYTNTYLSDPSIDKEGRGKIKERFAYKIDGHSGLRIAKSILKEFKSL